MKKSPYFNYESEKGFNNSHFNIDKKMVYSDKSDKEGINFF